VAVAFLLPGRAKDLSAPPRNNQVIIEAPIHRFNSVRGQELSMHYSAETDSASHLAYSWNVCWTPTAALKATAAWPRPPTISSVDIKNIWSSSFQYPYACMSWSLINSRDESMLLNTVEPLLFYLLIQ